MTVEREQPSAQDLGGDVLSSIGLVLNVAAVICLALWVSTAGGSGSAAIVGVLTIFLFGASLVCFATDGQGHGDTHVAATTPTAAPVRFRPAPTATQ